MKASVAIRLSAMMFLNYFVWGAWYTTIGTWLTATLKFSGTEAGAIFGTTALASMISPFFVGLIADRYFRTERVLSALHAIGAVLLYFVAHATTFGAVYALMLLYCICFFPTIPLTNSLALRHLTNAGNQFPLVRVFATIGWICISLLIGFLAVERSPSQFLIAAGLSVAMSLFCLTLPETPPAARGSKASWRSIVGVDALVMLRDRSYLVFLIASVLFCIPLTFYFSFTNAFLNDVGVANAAGKMSLGQASEVIMMLLMPVIFRNFGVKAILCAGLVAWGARYLLLSLGNAGPGMWMFYAAILLHGICFDFFTITGQIYTDQEAPAHLRSTAQGFLTFLTYGVGMFAGSILSGIAVDAFTTTAGRNWHAFWLTSSIGSFAIFLFVAIAFKKRGTVTMAKAAAVEA